jgi:hypothetical protein
MSHPALSQSTLAFPQPVEDFLPVHASFISQRPSGFDRQISRAIENKLAIRIQLDTMIAYEHVYPVIGF